MNTNIFSGFNGQMKYCFHLDLQEYLNSGWTLLEYQTGGAWIAKHI